MVGFWGEGVESHMGDGLGPNMPLPEEAGWLEGAMVWKGEAAGEKREVGAVDVTHEVVFVDEVWEEVKVSTEVIPKFEEYHDADVGFTGRFFLRGKGAGEIDEEVRACKKLCWCLHTELQRTCKSRSN